MHDVSGMNLEKIGSKDHHLRNQRTVDSTNREHIYIVNKHTNGDSRSTDFQNSFVNYCVSSGETIEKCVQCRQNDYLVRKKSITECPAFKANSLAIHEASAVENTRKPSPPRRNVYYSLDSNRPPSRTKSAGEISLHDSETHSKYKRSFARHNSDISSNHKKSLMQEGPSPDHNINKSESSFTAEYYSMIKRQNTISQGTSVRRISVDNNTSSRVSSGSTFYTHVIERQQQIKKKNNFPEFPYATQRRPKPGTISCETQNKPKKFRLWHTLLLTLANFIIIWIIIIIADVFPNSRLLVA